MLVQITLRLGLGLLALAGVGCATNATAPVSAPLPLSGAPPVANTSLARDGIRDISAILDPIRARAKIPGMVAVVLRGDQIVAQGIAGVRKRGTFDPIAFDDQFWLCSATKAMTATLAAMVVEEGKLSLSTTLGEIFSDPGGDINPDWKPVTLAQLLNHTAGAPSDGSRLWTSLAVEFSRTSAAEKRRAMVTKTLSHAPAYPPGSRYLYTGIDYLIVGAMLEKVTGRSWEHLIREKLWLPLGIATGGFGAPGTPGKIDQPWGHWGMVFTGLPVAPDGFFSRLNPPEFYGPAATARMTVSDWAKFVTIHLRGDPANPHHAATLLKPDSFVALHQPAAGKLYESGWMLSTQSWALGHRPGDTGRVITSEGDNGFWHCDAWVAPEIDFAVLILINQGNAAGPTPAGLGVNDAFKTLVREFAPKPSASN